MQWEVEVTDGPSDAERRTYNLNTTSDRDNDRRACETSSTARRLRSPAGVQPQLALAGKGMRGSPACGIESGMLPRRKLALALVAVACIDSPTAPSPT